MSQAAELTVLASQGNLPGLTALAAAFAKASGHKVNVIQEVGKALEERLTNGPADLIGGNPCRQWKAWSRKAESLPAP